jgi:hypothetical protein
MSRKPVLWVAVAFTLILVPWGGPKCRGDEFDDKLKHFQKQRAGEALELKREVADALTRAHTLALTSPAKAEKALRASLARLLDDSQLPRQERMDLIRQVKDRLQGLEALAAAEYHKEVAHGESEHGNWDEGYAKPTSSPEWAAKLASSPSWPAKTSKAMRPSGQGLGNVSLGPITPVVSADRRFVRVAISGTFFFPNVNNSYVPIQTAIPTILYNGPPTGVSIGNPTNIFQVWVRQPQANPISIQSGGILIFP